VREGDYVEKGDYIVEGNPSPHDILRIKGMEELAIYLVKEIQDVYRLQGVKINDKHIEVICRQMMQKLEITDGGETTLIAGEHVDALELETANKKATDDGTSPPKAAPSCWASPRRACRRARSSRRPPSRKPRASSPTPRSMARWICWKA
jgi:DNA-directed RNA polymerase subunit beta'